MSNISFVELAEDIVIEIMMNEEFYDYDLNDYNLKSHNINGITDESSMEEILIFMLYDGHKNNFSRTHKIVESDNSDLSMSTKSLMKSLMSDISDLYFKISQAPRSTNISDHKLKKSTTEEKMTGQTEVLNEVRKITKKHKKKIEDKYSIY